MNTTMQLPFSGRELRDGGISVATEHADLVHKDWSENAYQSLKRFLLTQAKPFMCEQVRDFATTHSDLPQPPSNRAWGGVFRRAAHEKLIKHVGYGQVTNPKAHMANASMWQAV
jgi:hypothetical protein